MAGKSERACCQTGATKLGADNSAELARVNRIRGQVEGISRMISEKAYCPDIITQIQAVRSALGSLQGAVLSSHLNHCVRGGLRGGARETDRLLDELLQIFKHS